MDNNGSQLGFQANLVGKYPLLGRKHDLFLTPQSFTRKLDANWKQHTSTATYNVYGFNHNIAYPDFDAAPYRFLENEK